MPRRRGRCLPMAVGAIPETIRVSSALNVTRMLAACPSTDVCPIAIRTTTARGTRSVLTRTSANSRVALQRTIRVEVEGPRRRAVDRNRALEAAEVLGRRVGAEEDRDRTDVLGPDPDPGRVRVIIWRCPPVTAAQARVNTVCLQMHMAMAVVMATATDVRRRKKRW